DVGGNMSVACTGREKFRYTDGAAALSADYLFVAGDNGSKTFNATFNTAGTQSLTATDTLTASITGAQNNIVVNAGAAVSLVVNENGRASGREAGHSFTVKASDSDGRQAAGAA